MLVSPLVEKIVLGSLFGTKARYTTIGSSLNHSRTPRDRQTTTRQLDDSTTVYIHIYKQYYIMQTVYS